MSLLGEISEHPVAQLTGGERRDRGNHGFDLVDPAGEHIEVTSRQLSRWGDNLMFDFSAGPVGASEAYSVAWDDTASSRVVLAAFHGEVEQDA